MPGARREIGPEYAVFGEQLVRHSCEWRRAEDKQLGMMPGALIPSCQHETRVIATMIIMQVREEQMGNFLRGNPKLQQSMMRAKSMIKNDHVVAGLDHIPGAHPPQRRGGCTRSQQTNAHRRS
jgi:hypothetical protein